MKHVSGATQALPHRPQFVLLVSGSWHPAPHEMCVGGVHRGSRSRLNPSETSTEASDDASRATSGGAASAPASTGAKHMPPTHT